MKHAHCSQSVPKTLKHVESAIHSANLPGISPQKDSSRTLRIPISRPSSETRTAIEKMIADQGEAAKIRLRGARTDALKALVDKDGRKGKWGTEVSGDNSALAGTSLDTHSVSAQRLNKSRTSSAQRSMHSSPLRKRSSPKLSSIESSHVAYRNICINAHDTAHVASVINESCNYAVRDLHFRMWNRS